MLEYIGRKKELSELNSIKNRKLASFVVVRGRRRIGKSRLVDEFSKGTRLLKFIGLAPEKGVTAQDQRVEFARKLAYISQKAQADPSDWANLFDALWQEVNQGPLIVLLDEISWMAQDDATFLPKLKNAWDEQFKQNPQLTLVLCSSVSLWVDENILSSTSMFGRITESIKLDELSLHESMQLLEQTGYRGSAQEKFMLLMLTGGVPLYIELIRPDKSAIQNLYTLCFKANGILVDEYDKIFHDLFSRRAELYSNIVACLVNGRRARKEILEKIDYARSGTISHYLKDLVEAGFLDKHYAWSLQTGKKIRRSVYRLKDNFLRFSLKYIRPNLEKIAAGEFELEETFLQNKLYAIAGLQFENLVLNNRRLIYDALGIAASEVMNVGPYRQMPNSKQKGCQIDLLIQTRLNTLFVCEIKFSRDAITSEVIDEMKTKITHLKKPKQLTCVPVLIHINGVRDAVIDSDYFYRVINFTKFLVNESREV